MVVVELTRDIGNTPAGTLRVVERGDRSLGTGVVELVRAASPAEALSGEVEQPEQHLVLDEDREPVSR